GEYYTPSKKHNVSFFDKDKNYINRVLESRPNLYFQTPENCHFVRFSGNIPTSDFHKVLKLIQGQLNEFPLTVGDYELLIDKKDDVPVKVKTLSQDAFKSISDRFGLEYTPYIPSVVRGGNFENLVEGNIDYNEG